jgi:hypothetical protein
MVRKDGGRAEQLFGEHCPDQQVRPGRGPERQQQVGVDALLLAMAVGGADQEASLALAVIAPSSFFASSAEENALPLSSRAMLTLFAGISGGLPPRSGSSVTLVGHAIRFR